MKRLAKRKLFWFTVAYACILAVALVFSLGTETEHYECTLEDIMNNKKISGTASYIWNHNLNKSDTIGIFIDFYQKPSDSEIDHLESLGIEVFQLWTPNPYDPPSGFTAGRCKVENLCKFIDLDFVSKVSAQMEVSPHEED
jgi:hypothetical protein